MWTIAQGMVFWSYKSARRTKTILSILIFLKTKQLTLELTMKASIILGFVLVAAILPVNVKSEVFTALIHMEGLLHLERQLLGVLNEYITAEKSRFVA